VISQPQVTFWSQVTSAVKGGGIASRVRVSNQLRSQFGISSGKKDILVVNLNQEMELQLYAHQGLLLEANRLY
jgi:hypothetical protein